MDVIIIMKLRKIYNLNLNKFSKPLEILLKRIHCQKVAKNSLL